MTHVMLRNTRAGKWKLCIKKRPRREQTRAETLTNREMVRMFSRNKVKILMILMQFADTRFFTPFRCSLRSYPCASTITPNNTKESWESDAHPFKLYFFLETTRSLILHELKPDLRTAIPVTVRLLCMHLSAERGEKKKEKQKKEKKKGEKNPRCQSAFYQ